MALKIMGKLEELRKTEEKIQRLQEKKKLLERSIKRDEDEEIVRTLRSLKLSHEELVGTLDDLRAGNINAADLKNRAYGDTADKVNESTESVDRDKKTSQAVDGSTGAENARKRGSYEN